MGPLRRDPFAGPQCSRAILIRHLSREKHVITRRRMILGAAGSVALTAGGLTAGLTSRAFAQATPGSGKLVRVMNGFPPGGSADVVTRMITDKLRASYAPTAIVENRPGGGGRTVLE